MTSFMETVQAMPVKKGSLGVFFLGQAGFLLKLSSGKLLAVDPYLSNCCERFFGFKRLMPRILEPAQITLDLLLVSHGHYDHFDPDSVPALLKPQTAMIAAQDVKAECEKLGLQGEFTFLSCGESAQCADVQVTAVACDHGELAPEAVGLLIRAEGKTVYYMGDTAYRPDLLDDPALQNVDLLLLPINGAFGNLNEQQAAQVVAKLRPRLAVPCHYWNFAEHGGNPGLFQQAMAEVAENCPYRLMAQGEGILI